MNIVNQSSRGPYEPLKLGDVLVCMYNKRDGKQEQYHFLLIEQEAGRIGALDLNKFDVWTSAGSAAQLYHDLALSNFSDFTHIPKEEVTMILGAKGEEEL